MLMIILFIFRSCFSAICLFNVEKDACFIAYSALQSIANKLNFEKLSSEAKAENIEREKKGIVLFNPRPEGK
jgi:hypothetical protein